MNLNIQFIFIFCLILLIKFVNAQRSSNGRHRTWWGSTEEEPPQSSLVINEDLVINQKLPSKKDKNSNNNNYNNNSSIIVNIDDHHSINLTPEPSKEPLPAEILKVDLIKSNMLLVASSPTYTLNSNNNNQTIDQEEIREEKNLNNNNHNGNNINFVEQSRRMLNSNLASKNCLSTLDCDLELNERCLLPENEEMHYYEELSKVQSYTSIYSQYLRKKWKSNLKSTSSYDQNVKNQRQPICGCSSPSFVRNQVTGQCELMRVVELKFRLRTDRTIVSDQSELSEQNFEQLSKLESRKNYYFQKQTNLHQLKLDALGQIDHVLRQSDSLQDIVHHFRLTSLTPLFVKNKHILNSEEAFEKEDVEIDKIKKKRYSRSTTSRLIRMQNQFIARGLLLLFGSEFTANFDLLFTNEYCSTQNTLRMKAQEMKAQKMIHQALAATNQTLPTIHFNTIRSADYWSSFNINTNAKTRTNANANNTLISGDDFFGNQSDRIKNSMNNRNRNTRLIEMPFIYHRKREIAKEQNSERYGLDVQLIEVNSEQINICALNANYLNEQLNEARRKYDLDDEKLNNSKNLTSLSAKHLIELEKKQKQLDYESKFFRLTYCDDSRAFCDSVPKSKIGYICVCHDNLMDLSPLIELPGIYST